MAASQNLLPQWVVVKKALTGSGGFDRLHLSRKAEPLRLTTEAPCESAEECRETDKLR